MRGIVVSNRGFARVPEIDVTSAPLIPRVRGIVVSNRGFARVPEIDVTSADAIARAVLACHDEADFAGAAPASADSLRGRRQRSPVR